MRKIYLKQLMRLSLILGLAYPGISWATTNRVERKASEKSNLKKPHNRIEVTGTIVDNFGNALFGVKVSIKETGLAVYTDKYGKYIISAVEGDILVFTLNGYLVKEEAISGATLNVTLVESSKNKDTSPVLYGEQSKKTSVQSTATVYNKDLIKVPVATTTNALSGRLAGVYTIQSTGRPGFDGATISVRGRSPLVLINGVPRNYTSIDPEQIESVTVLKDGLSTVMLGQQAADGIIMITTRKGETGKQRISVTAQAGLQSPIKLPRPVGAFDYATLYNEALANDGFGPQYSAADLDAWRTGADPIGHPDVDWYETILRKNTVFSRYNINTYGGGNSTRYFLDVDYLNQSGILKQDEKNTYSTNINFKRYLVRTNIDVDITPSTLLNLNLFGRIQNGNQPGGAAANSVIFTDKTDLSKFGSNNVFSQLASIPSNAYPVFNPNGSLGGTQDYQTNLWGATTQSGYYYDNSRDITADISLKKTLDELLKGLWVKGLASFNTSASENIVRTKGYAVYRLANTNPETYQKFGLDDQQVNFGYNDGQSRNLYVDFSSGLDRTFGKNNISALIKVNSQNFRSGSSIAYINTNFAGRLAYNYMEKYMVEGALSYSGLNRYVEGERFGLFYAFGLGWNLKKENFLKDTKWLDELKLRANYGYTGNANPGYFAYNQYYDGGSGYTYGTGNGATTSGIDEGALANPDITWEKSCQYDVGLDITAFGNRVNFTVDYFNNKLYDLIQTRGKNTTILGISFPNENIGRKKYSGFEFEVSYNNHIGNFNYFIAPNVFSLQKIIKYQDEVYRPYPWMVRTGQRDDQTYGYVAEGLFQSQAEVNAAAKFQGYNARPGDIKYSDLNNDGIINEFDVKALSNNKAIWFYGVNMGFNYKNFDFSALFQGVQNKYIYLNGDTQFAFLNNGLGNAFESNLGRWTPETASTATHPRLTVGANPNNNATSSYWLKDGSYVRLKNIELGYSVPKSLASKLKLASIRVFVNAVNVFTIAGYNKVDPEVYGDGYPLQKVWNAGLNVKF